MSLSFCVPPDYGKFPPGTSFEGIIRTIVSADRKLCFVIPKDDYVMLKKSEKFRPDPATDALDKLPKIGKLSLFHYKSRDKMYRAYAMSGNSPAIESRALFLYDTGEMICDKLSKDQFYVLPDELEVPLAFAVFARIKVAAEDHKTVRIENMMKKVLKFTVLKNSPDRTEEIAVHMRARCLVLGLNETDIEINSDDDDIASPKIDEIEPIYSAVQSKFTLDDLPKLGTCNVSAGSLILVYPLTCAAAVDDDKSSIFHVNIANNMPNDFVAFSNAIISEGFALKSWLNKLMVVAQLRCIEDDDDEFMRPAIGELLIAACANVAGGESFERVVVKRVHSSGRKAEVFSIDHGCTHRLNTNELFKFPIKCSTQPPQCVHLTASNFNRTTMTTLPSVVMGRVESTTFVSSQLHMCAKLYDLMGRSLG